MNSCPQAPDGAHCDHYPTGPWYGVTPPQGRCCWCGQTTGARHGPHAPRSGWGTWCLNVSQLAPNTVDVSL